MSAVPRATKRVVHIRINFLRLIKSKHGCMVEEGAFEMTRNATPLNKEAAMKARCPLLLSISKYVSSSPDRVSIMTRCNARYGDYSSAKSGSSCPAVFVS
jgi:hypothetical protein